VKHFPAATARSFNAGRDASRPGAGTLRTLPRLLSLAAIVALLFGAAAVAAPAAAGTPASAVPAAPQAVERSNAPVADREGTSFLDSPDLAEAPGSAMPTVGVTLARVLGATLLIVAFLVGGGLLFKRFAKRALNFSRRADSPLRVVERVALGPKNQVCLIQACGRYLVIGATEKEINVLMEVTLPGEEDAAGEFAAMLGGAESVQASGREAALLSSQAGGKLHGRRQN